MDGSSGTPMATDEGSSHAAGPRGGADLPRPPEVAVGRPGWTGGRITAVVVGALLGLVALVLLAAGGTALWATWTQRDDGYITTDAHGFFTGGSALVTESTDLGSAGYGWLYSPSLLDEVRIRVTPASEDASLFVGIGPSAEVDRYLAGVTYMLISDFWTGNVQPIGGAAPASAPGAQDFWVATDTGAGSRTLTWEPTDGSWTVVVMNADGSSGIDVRADLGATIPAVWWIALGLLLAGAVFLAGGVLLIVGALRARAGR